MWSLIALIHLHYIEKSRQDITEERSPNIIVSFIFGWTIPSIFILLNALVRAWGYRTTCYIHSLSHCSSRTLAIISQLKCRRYVPSLQRHAGCLCVCFHFIHVTVWLNHHLLYLFLSFLLQLQNKDELFISVENDLTKMIIPALNPSESAAKAPLLPKKNYVIKATGAQLCVYSLFDDYSISLLDFS